MLVISTQNFSLLRGMRGATKCESSNMKTEIKNQPWTQNMKLKELPPETMVAVAHPDYAAQPARRLVKDGLGEYEVRQAAPGLTWQYEFRSERAEISGGKSIWLGNRNQKGKQE